MERGAGTGYFEISMGPIHKVRLGNADLPINVRLARRRAILGRRCRSAPGTQPIHSAGPSSGAHTLEISAGAAVEAWGGRRLVGDDRADGNSLQGTFA